MAWLFDEVNDDVRVADNAALSFPDGDWSLGGFLYTPDNTGSAFQYFYSHDSFQTDPSINIFIHEASAVNGGAIHVIIDNDDVNIVSADSAIKIAEWQHLLFVRSGTTVTMYQNNVSLGTDSLSVESNPAGSLFLGSRNDSNSDRFFGGRLAEWAKWNRALTTGERGALTAGYSPEFFRDYIWYLSMIREYRESRGLAVTNNGSVQGDHPPIIRPRPPYQVSVSAAAAPVGFAHSQAVLIG